MPTPSAASPLFLARGYRFAGLHCGIRPDPARSDLALVVSDRPASAAGVFTRNRVCAAPVRVCRERLPSPSVRGVVICSGNANACTGPQGMADARRMAAVAAETLGVAEEAFLVASTGVIGRPLPMSAVEPGIRKGVPLVTADAAGLDAMARAILTTDTVTKVFTRVLTLDGVEVRLTGVAKGAAMIGPSMATMLAFVFTDAAVHPADLAAMTTAATQKTFDCVSVEGHMSTNDTLLVLANGAAGGDALAGASLVAFGEALTGVCADLALAIASDAEGADHLIVIDVVGTRTDADARRVAKTVAESALVKTAVFGRDPNWGRVVSAAGYSGVEFDEEDLSLTMGDTPLYVKGVPVPFDAAAASAYLRDNREVRLTLTFTLGHGRCRMWTCDLTYEYVKLNAEYTT